MAVVEVEVLAVQVAAVLPRKLPRRPRKKRVRPNRPINRKIDSC